MKEIEEYKYVYNHEFDKLENLNPLYLYVNEKYALDSYYKDSIKEKFYRVCTNLYIYKTPMLVFASYPKPVKTKYVNPNGRKANTTQIYRELEYYLVNINKTEDNEEYIGGLTKTDYRKSWWLLKK